MKRIIMLLTLFAVTAVLAGCNESQKEESAAEATEIVEETTGYTSPDKPFENISRDEIQSVSVDMFPSNKKADLSETQIDEFTEILRDYVIYQENNTYGEYMGSSNIFYITKTDGELMIMEAGSFLVIDGTGYIADLNCAEKVGEFIDKHLTE